MERPRFIPQLYGYAVCLVSVVTILVASNNVIDGLFDAVSPEMSREVMFDVRARVPAAPPDGAAPQPPPRDAAAIEREEVERRDRIALVRHHGVRRIVGSGATLLIAIGLFVMHWRWLRGMGRSEPA